MAFYPVNHEERFTIGKMIIPQQLCCCLTLHKTESIFFLEGYFSLGRLQASAKKGQTIMKAIYTLTLTIILGLGITLIGFYSLSAAGAQVPNAIKPLEPQIVGAPLPYAMGRQFVHWVTESNRLLNLTYISSPFIVDANAILFVTPNLNPVGSGGIF